MLPESRYERLDAIERRLAQTPHGCTTGDLARTFGVSDDTIRRDICELEARGTGLVKDGRRYILDHRRSLYRVKFTTNEILALYLAARLLSRHSDEHNPHVVQALEKLADALRDRSPLIAGHIDQAAAAVAARHSRPHYVEALEALVLGWATGKKVRIRYRAANNTVTKRVIAPYFIEPSGIGYACYVIGFDDMRGEVRTFKVERITESSLLEERFTLPPDFNPQQLLANAWGVIWRDAGAIEVQLRFAPSVARRVKESVWHHTQRIEGGRWCSQERACSS